MHEDAQPRGQRPERPRGAPFKRPPLRIMPTTLWEYPSQHYNDSIGRTMQGSKEYVGATPSWVIWQLLQRYTREGDVIVDPMCGSGTTIDVCADLKRTPVAFDLAPSRPDIKHNDARRLPLKDASADFVFIDPPNSTHVDYSDDPRCIGKLDSGGDDDGRAYFTAMRQVIREIHRVMKDRRYMALNVSDSFKKLKGKPGGAFIPIGFELFAIMREFFKPIDIISVVRHNQKLDRGNWRKAAEEGNFFLRGFNYLFIMKKEESPAHNRE
jgi:DNA modification methylase